MADAIVVHVCPLAFGGPAAGQRRDTLAIGADRVAILEGAVAVLSDQFVLLLSDPPCLGRVHGDDLVAAVDEHDPGVDVFHERPVHLLAAAQGIQDVLPFGDVACRAAVTAEIPIGVKDRNAVGFHGHEAARLVDIHVLDAAEGLALGRERGEDGRHSLHFFGRQKLEQGLSEHFLRFEAEDLSNVRTDVGEPALGVGFPHAVVAGFDDREAALLRFRAGRPRPRSGR